MSDFSNGAPAPSSNPAPGFRGVIANLAASPGLKFIMMGVITTLLLIPSLLVWALVEERADRSRTVERTISQGWGNEQSLNGPYLIVPYTKEYTDAKGVKRQQTKHVFYSAKTASIDMDVAVEERKLSIYSTPLYHSKTAIKGRFDPIDLGAVTIDGGVADVSKAFVAMAISDPAGIRSEVAMKIGNKRALPFKPGMRQVGQNPIRGNNYQVGHPKSGIHIPVDPADARSGFAFEMTANFNGSRFLSIAPSAEITNLRINSDWPHPGFAGRFLPEERTITRDGFSANWTIPSLARGVDSVLLGNTLPSSYGTMQTNFVKPLEFYQMVSRTLKYAIAFLSLAFLAVFVLEMKSAHSIHWIQYVLMGLAMVVFYILLLALAEHVGFTPAYLVSALATTSLIGWYVGDSLGDKRGGWVMAAVIGLTYALMYLVLREQDYALLAGSIVAFAAIATTMIVTRRVNWNGSTSARTNGPQGEQVPA